MSPREVCNVTDMMSVQVEAHVGETKRGLRWGNVGVGSSLPERLHLLQSLAVILPLRLRRLSALRCSLVLQSRWLRCPRQR